MGQCEAPSDWMSSNSGATPLDWNRSWSAPTGFVSELDMTLLLIDDGWSFGNSAAEALSFGNLAWCP